MNFDRVITKNIDFSDGMDSSWELLEQLRTTVRETKEEMPELHNYVLEDLGVSRQEQGIEVKMYFNLQ